MSKRSYRRLAVVAGAGLAIGSMAPAMAAQLNVSGTGAANATVNVPAVTPTTPPPSTLVPTSLVHGIAMSLFDDVETAHDLLTEDVRNLRGDVRCLVQAGTSAAANASAGALTGVNVGPGGANVNVRAIANAAVPTSGISHCVNELRADVFDTAGDVKVIAGEVAHTATFAASGAYHYAQFLRNTALNTASGVVANPPAPSILVSGGANAAAILSLF